MASGRGRGRGHGRGRGRDFIRGRGSFGGDHNSSCARLTVSPLVIRGPGYVSTVEGLTTSLKSVGRNLRALNGHN